MATSRLTSAGCVVVAVALCVFFYGGTALTLIRASKAASPSTAVPAFVEPRSPSQVEADLAARAHDPHLLLELGASYLSQAELEANTPLNRPGSLEAAAHQVRSARYEPVHGSLVRARWALERTVAADGESSVTERAAALWRLGVVCRLLGDLGGAGWALDRASGLLPGDPICRIRALTLRPRGS